MAGSLLDGVALVTGAGSGIGRYTTFSLAHYGIKQLAVADIQLESLQETAAMLEKRYPHVETLQIQMDISQEQSVKVAIQKVIDKFHRLDIAVNNAGIGGAIGPSHAMDLAEWERMISVNLNGTWLCQREEIRHMLQQQPLKDDRRSSRGVIVNVASGLGIVGPRLNMPSIAYSASKHGVIGFTKADGIHYAQQGIRINAINPGCIETPLVQTLPEDILKDQIANTPLGRLGFMEEVGDAIVFLASPLSSFVVASSVMADGGLTAQ